MPSPTALTLRELRRLGYLAAVVERWLPHANLRQDLFGFADVLGVHARDGLFLLCQTTTVANLSSRLKKALGRPELRLWLKAGGKFHLHGWRQRDDGQWVVRRVDVTLNDLGMPAAPIVLGSRRRRRRDRQPLLFD